ncbi:thiolase family protein|uniref:Acetoacetyl-CoA thiolase n=1 Tax=Dendrosporobacter quercicolus TaxID=146817 RepID=A0A1G9QXM4_9FIRM|nr:thiolase family protein [Dendrosporobacter quercicolus]NSL48402.1 thiolase family protein [Dendrosporobacter quercicolus DSM 1736]SDM15620.1 acetyl-CoA C-acetyltransferase [Dendrosporobacter quercicolus]
MSEAYLIGGLRTPIGKTNGILKGFLPEQLAAGVLQEIISRYGLAPQDIDQVILGNAVGPGGNIARVAVLEAGWPYACPALTVDTQCGSGLSAVELAVAQIRSGQAELVIAGGVESTSMAPRRQFNVNDPRFAGEAAFYEQAPFSPPAVGNPGVGEAAEALARQLDISREDMDKLALLSHKKACQARERKVLKDIILPLAWQGTILRDDECLRDNMSSRLLARMKGAFAAGGRITAGNACLKHDGAAAVLIASRAAMQRRGLRPGACIAGTVSTGCDPNVFPLGPVNAIRRLLDKQGLRPEQLDAIEINEAFAVKILACCRELGLCLEKVNQLGGALAYGHPYGASGAMILLHLLTVLEQGEGRFGAAAIGAVGGIGVAVLLERC